MKIIEPHIHMYSRTTNDYQNMYNAGIRACVEPSFWLGSPRRYAGTFFDYFQHLLEFETVRAERFGIDHYTAISVNPKESDNVALVDEVLEGIEEYLDHPRCVAVGEIGYNNLTDNEEHSFVKQLHLAKKKNLPVIVHLPHFHKPEGVRRIIKNLIDEGMDQKKIIIDHNIEETLPVVLGETDCFAGMTVYPISKLTPERVSNIIRENGSEKVIVNGSADWGISDPLSLLKVVNYMKKDGHTEETIKHIVFDNAMAFYSQSAKWDPDLDIEPQDPETFQR